MKELKPGNDGDSAEPVKPKKKAPAKKQKKLATPAIDESGEDEAEDLSELKKTKEKEDEEDFAKAEAREKKMEVVLREHIKELVYSFRKELSRVRASDIISLLKTQKGYSPLVLSKYKQVSRTYIHIHAALLC